MSVVSCMPHIACEQTQIVLSLNLCFYGLKPDPEKHDWPADLDKPYDVKEKLWELIGAQLLSGDDRHPAIPLRQGIELRLATTELRGDWKWHKESFNLLCGWNSNNLCHHCTARKDDFLRPPYLKSRRDLISFKNQCKPGPDGKKCPLDD